MRAASCPKRPVQCRWCITRSEHEWNPLRPSYTCGTLDRSAAGKGDLRDGMLGPFRGTGSSIGRNARSRAATEPRPDLVPPSAVMPKPASNGGGEPVAVFVPPLMEPRASLPRIRQVEWDHYYMEIANTVASRANCTGSHVGAVIVSENRIVSTGFNGTPAGFPNCESGGCVRCRDRQLDKAGRHSEMADRQLGRDHKHLDLCICVHAEANAMLSAARFGIRTDGATLYSTHQPCFTCLKEAVQAGIARVVYLQEWWHADSKALKQMYNQLAEHLRSNDERNFEQLHRQRDLLAGTSTIPRAPNLDDQIVSIDDPDATVKVRHDGRSAPNESKPRPTKRKRTSTAR